MYDFTVIVLEGAYATGVAVTRDLLAAAEALARRSRSPVPRWRLCSLAGGPVQLAGGLSVDTAKLPLGSRTDRSTWVVPGLAATTPAAVAERVARDDAGQISSGLRRHVQRGGKVAVSCSAVFLLQAAQLLDARRVTTTWWLARYLQALSPRCRVDVDRMICVDGALTTAGAAFAQADLVLHLLRERFGTALASEVSRMTLVDARQAQGPYVDVGRMAGGNALVEQIVARVEALLPEAPSVAILAREFCLSERTLTRHVRRATGKSTLALIQAVRLRRARSLLEASRWSVERVAEAVGYQGSSTLRRLMKRATGSTPRAYRHSR